MNEAGVNYLNSLEKWHGAGGFSLQSVLKVAPQIGDPQDRFRAIHIAGTNGKGSVSAAVSRILSDQGAKVGLTTSPHLSRINERIVIDGSTIADGELYERAARLSVEVSRAGVNLSYFEAIILLAFLSFHEEEVDYGVVEVGLGGRLDATNIIAKPEICSIVSIDLDHQDILGCSIEAIAAEKGGIIKHKVPVVVGDLYPEAREVVRRISNERSAPLIQYGSDFGLRETGGGIEYWSKFGKGHLTPSLSGKHQFHNMAVAISIAEHLGISTDQALLSCARVFWPGRAEVVQVKGASLLMDGGHNPAGFQALSHVLRNVFGDRKVRLAFGAVSRKEWQQMLEVIGPQVSQWAVLEPDSADAVKGEVIERHLSSIGIKEVERFDRDYDRYLSSLSEKRGEVLAGSLYLLGGIREKICGPIKRLW